MTVCIQLHLKNKKVLIVGGGKVAYRKAKQFLEEGALVTILSPMCREEFHALPVRYMQHNYQCGDCEQFFYVYAATNDRLLNHAIVVEANDHNILCGSATKDEQATSSSMSVVDNQDIACAVSTYGVFPAWNEILTKELATFLEEHVQGKASYLKQIRTHLLNSKANFTLWTDVARLSIQELQFIVAALKKQSCILYAFHGVANATILQALYESMGVFEKENEEKAHGVVFLSAKVCQKLQQRVSSLSHMVHLLKEMKIQQIAVIPMLVSEGEFEQRVTSFCQEEELLCYAALLYTQEITNKVIDAYARQYPNKQVLLVTHDEFSPKTWTYLQNSIQPYPNLRVVSFQEMPTYKKAQQITLIPFVMLLGFHATQDILYGIHSIRHKLQVQGHQVENIELALFDQPFIKKHYIKIIRTIT